MLNEVTLEGILSEENLGAAAKAVIANGGGPGIDGMRTGQLAGHLSRHGETIRVKVLAGKYKPSPVRRIWIAKAGGGKRPLGIPTVVERCLQQAIQQKLTEVFDPLMSEHSYGFRPGRSAHDAVRAALEHVENGKDCVVDIDLKSFFDEVNHDILMNRLHERISDKRVLKLIGRYLRAGVNDDGQWHSSYKGVPQGGPLSPLLANVYLDPLDKELQSRGLSFCRYADDCNIYVSSERAGERVFASIAKWIEIKLRIPVNRDKSGIGKPWQRQFLGYQITEELKLKPAPKSMKRYQQRVREIFNARIPRTSTQLRDDWLVFIRGWCAYYALADEPWWRVGLSSWTRRRVRCCFWKRWHKASGRRNALRKLGLSDEQIKAVPVHANAWAASRLPGMHKALNNRLLKSLYFLVPVDFAPA